MEGQRERTDWAALRAEYAAGGISQKALAEKHGVSYGAVRGRARDEGWKALRARERAGNEDEREESESEIAIRVRRKLLMKLERMTDQIPDGAVTEQKTQDDSAVMLFKLRDLTAAYKELTGDLELEEEGRDGVKVIVDVGEGVERQ